MRLALLTMIICSLCGAAEAQESVLDRRIMADAPGAAVVWLPDGISNGMFAWRIAECSSIPLVFEAFPFEYRDPAATVQRVDLAGLTVRDALDLLVAHAPLYRWHERDGVVIIRPISFESGPDDPLNRRIAGMRGDQLQLDDVHGRVIVAAGGAGVSSRVPAPIDSQKFSVDIPGGTVLDVLVAAARAHGRVMWSVPDGVQRADKDSFSLGFRTFTRVGAGTSGADAR